MRLSLRTRFREVTGALANRLPKPLAIALGLAVVDPEYAGAIRGAQIRAIVRLTPLAMAASCLNSVIVLVTCAYLGVFRPEFWIWAFLLFAAAARYILNWRKTRTYIPDRPAPPKSIRRAVMHGGIFGALWGSFPAIAFPGAPLDVQLLVGVLSAGMMCAGAFVLATVPLAGALYVAVVAAGALYALLQDPSPVHLAIVGLLVSYTAVVVVNLSTSAALFVSSRLAEAQVRKEVAAREQAQAEAAHAERMTALGELAGGIAHDFNNILQAIGGSAALIDRHLEDPPYVGRQTQRIEDAVDRGGSISRRLLAFARRDVLSAEVIETADLLAEMREFLAPAIGPAISVRIEVPAAPTWILADRRQLETVLLNLATNAKDAMPQGGNLDISAASEMLDCGSEALGLDAGRYVRLEVVDDGAGMDAAVLARSAEPFFTTKPKGKGTGLGLPMAKGFAEQSGGAFSIASVPGRGTTVTLWLPEAEAPHTAPPVPARILTDRALNAPGRVLVVDDDDLVRETLILSLKEAGVVAVGVRNVDDALSELEGGVDVDAVITDLSMPGRSGWELLRELRTNRPELPAIMLTGHVGDLAAEALGHPHAERFLVLQKPVSPQQLALELSMLIGGAPAAC
jgi:signal transduction histidine kinase/CheY-like chemotaxis protein